MIFFLDVRGGVFATRCAISAERDAQLIFVIFAIQRKCSENSTRAKSRSARVCHQMRLLLALANRCCLPSRQNFASAHKDVFLSIGLKIPSWDKTGDFLRFGLCFQSGWSEKHFLTPPETSSQHTCFSKRAHLQFPVEILQRRCTKKLFDNLFGMILF